VSVSINAWAVRGRLRFFRYISEIGRHQCDAQSLFHHSLRRFQGIQLHGYVGDDAGLAEEVVDEAVVGRAAVEEYDRLHRRRGNGGLAALRKRVLRVHCEHDLVVIQVHGLDFGAGQGTRDGYLYLVGE
jgi:hypothetical protein